MSLEEENAAVCAQQLRTATKNIQNKKEHIDFLKEQYPNIPLSISKDAHWQNIWEYLYSRSYGQAFQNLIRFLCHHDLIKNVDPYEVMRGEGYFDNNLYQLRVSLHFNK